jgi:hypothetical protein
MMEHACESNDGDKRCDICDSKLRHDCVDANKDLNCDLCFEKMKTVAVEIWGAVNYSGVTIEIYREGDAQPLHTWHGDNNEYAIVGSFVPGKYTLKASGDNLLTVTYTFDIEWDTAYVEWNGVLRHIGDLNGDRKINMKDWSVLYGYISDTENLSDEQKLAADVTGDGKVNMKDWSRLADHINETRPLW